jgi:hypothetical protein
MQYKKTEDGTEYWYENNKIIRMRLADGKESLWKYNALGKEIYRKWFSGLEVWFEYDETGHCIRSISSNGHEEFYDSHGKKFKERYNLIFRLKYIFKNFRKTSN